MAVKHHLHVNGNVCFISVTSYPWSGSDSNASKLPTLAVVSRSMYDPAGKGGPEL